ncbi:MAG: flagellar hook basal-body protein [Chloroflexi bacterium]|nr:flagellar hook basal-body protein [Chloroflexota bacterium]
MTSSLFHILNISRQDILSRLNDLDVTSNNLANINTAGYKTSRSNFQELLDKQVKEGNKLVGTQLITTQGTIKPSENPLDWAIEGDGFFSVTMPDGKIGYTRDGQFVMDANRQLVTASGYPLVWDGTILEGMTNINVDTEGKVTALQADGTSTAVGTVQLTRFTNPTALSNNGENIWMENASSGIPQTGAAASENYGKITGKMVEQSNVDLSQEMTHMMTLQRSFSMSIKAFQQTDTMISQAINLRKA